MNNRISALALAATLLAGLPLGARAQAPPPLVPPPPPPPPVSAGDTPGGGPFQAAPTTLGPITGSLPLRYKFTHGQVFRYQISLDTEGNLLTGPSEGTPIRQHVDMTLHQTVEDVRASDGAATLATQIDSLSATRDGKNVPLSKAAQQQLKQATTTVVDPTGKVLSFDRPAGAGAAAIPGLNFSPLDFQGLNALSADPVGMIVNILAADPVTVSDTWRSTYTTPTGSLEEHTADTLSSGTVIDGDTLVTIGQKLYAEFKPPKPGAESNAAHLLGLVTGTGQTQFDVDAGVINSQTTAMQINLKAVPSKSNAAGTPTPVMANLKVKSTLTRVHDDGTPVTPPGTILPTMPVFPANPAPAPTDEPPTGQLQ